MIRIMFSFVILSLSYVCSGQSINTETKYEVANQTELAIQTIVLKDVILDRDKGTVFLVNRTASDVPDQTEKNLKLLTKQVGGELQSATVKNFIDTNSVQINLVAAVCSVPQCLLIGREEAVEIFTNDVARLRAKNTYPGLEGSVSVSRVGFNPDRTQAIVYRTRYSGPKSGMGEYVFLIRLLDQWVIKKRLPVWLS